MKRSASGLASRLAAWLVGGVLIAGCTGGSVVGGPADGGADVVSDLAPSCTAPQSLCGNRCVDPQTDPAHCGACGRACGASMLCVAGTCQLTCPAGTACGGTCVDTQTDNANCGACGRACGAGQVCSLGACATTCATSLATCGGGDAGAGRDGGAASYCADLRTDRLNCGACGTACPMGTICVDRACALTCSVGQTQCSGACYDLQTDNAHCGACGNACPAGTACTAGVCAVSCGTGLTQCGDRCVNLQTENANCGGCGTACGAGQVCSGGVCSTSCATPLATCSSAAGAYCANTSIDPANCGMCGRACSLANAVTAGCTDGVCGVVRCAVGFGDCDGAPANGCETDTRDSVANCGGCGRACVLPNATPTCAAGTCAVMACAAGFVDCDRDPANGCEVNTQTENANCGGCGTVCGAGQVCSAGACGTTCGSPLATCSAAAGSYCANTQNDPANCGACGTACALANTAVQTCVAGACGVARCEPGFGDCDMLMGTGCETSLLTSATSCGACGRACSLPNASSTCAAGACGVRECNPGFADCNARAADGCEVALQTDNANCGACGRTCGDGQVCSAGACTTTCAAPLRTCGAAAAQFCADVAVDPQHCGACGAACSLPNVSNNACASGACAVGACNASFGDCDRVAANGCETNLAVSGDHCGACGRACALANANSTCASGACGVSSCAAGFANCNGRAADGCEVALQTDNANCGACGRTCGDGQVCSAGACTTTCAAPLATCSSAAGSYCANTASDPANCGACGRACALTNASISGCNASACVVVTCGTGFGNCDGSAANGCEAVLATDSLHCGGCGRACAGGQTCSAGACVCPSGQSFCDGACVDLRTNTANCGVCGRACALANANSTCAAGACAVTTCGSGFADCDGVASNGCEVNTQTDSTRCGGCGTVCAPGQVCSRGACTTTCAAPLTTCASGTTSAYCANVGIDPANCGMCGRVCALANTVTAGCGAGACTVQACAAGFGDCDGAAANGCEANLLTSGASCGACGRACTLANASAACTAGACGITACAAGFANCDGAPANGCEVNLQADNGNCGACGRTCGDGQVCSSGACTTTCASPLTTCGTLAAAYCANTASDPSNCGTCGRVCALTGATAVGCASGACTVLTCATGLGDCNGTAADGCETNLGNTLGSCGACGRACALANAGEACVGGTCAITTCASGFQNCNASAADGCEVNTSTDNANCGACGRGCADGQVCSGGNCVATCGSPLSLCSGGCVNLTNDPTNCGVCMRGCTAGDNAIPVCAASACAYVCTAGFADCDRVATNGCEVNVNTSVTSCGTCGTVCPTRAHATSTCAAGACGFTCDAGWGNCDGMAANGCETDLTTSTNCGTCGTSCGVGMCTAGSCDPTCYTGAARVLIYGPGGTGSQSFFPAGTTVVVASDAMWRAMTTADFSTYDVLWVDGNRCTGTTAAFRALSDTQAAWGPAVTGRVAVNPADPDFHSRGTYIANHVRWLAAMGRTSTGGRTSLYFSWGCTLRSIVSPVPADFITSLGGPLASVTDNNEPTGFTAAGTGHPLFTGIDLSGLRWANYCHGAFSAIPTGYTSLLNCSVGGNSGLFVRPMTCVP